MRLSAPDESEYSAMSQYDVIGVGFGPSNLALTIALDERTRELRSKCLALFIEKQPQFAWHGGMLLPDSNMQISFLKDLVTLRNPTSPFTFVNYLHRQGRLEVFINCRTFYPTRVEFNDYLRWVADHYRNMCCYGETVIAVEPMMSEQFVTALRIRSRTLAGNETIRYTRNLVVAVGGAPIIPAVFAPAADHPRVLHSSRYLDAIETIGLAGGMRIAVIGGGQSAIEATIDLRNRFPGLSVDLVFRGHALRPSDNSPFVNEIFDPDYTDFIFAQSAEHRKAIIRYFRNANYAVVDSDLIDQLYRMIYQQRVSGTAGITLHPRSEITNVSVTAGGIDLIMNDRFSAQEKCCSYDGVILATGYDRQNVHAFLEPVERYIEDVHVNRNYSLVTSTNFKPKIYLQGCSEMSHGLSDTLLSVLAVRSRELADSLLLFGGCTAESNSPTSGTESNSF